MTQSIEIQRKLVAIFAADVEGFTRLTAADEGGTLTILKSQRAILDDAIGRHRGRIANTAGDSVLAEFPSVTDAVRCAVEAQAAMRDAAAALAPERRVLFRIGIHVGDVITQGADLMGTGVNIAARLQAIAPAGGIVISAAAHDQVRKTLALAWRDLGEQRVKNLDEAVRAFAVGKESETAPSLASTALSDLGKPLPLPDKPSIAVLPFQNMSGDPEQEYFADGMVEDIITALSRFKSLFVIARNSSFTYKGKAVDVKQVGRELGVRYVLEGSVRKAGGRLRITGQLIEATSGSHLWAEKFDGALENVFDLQDQLALSVVGAILPALQRAEIERMKRKRPTDLDAYDWYLRGMTLTNAYQPQAALPCFRTAISTDDGYADAYAMIGCSYVNMRAMRGDPLASDEIADAVLHANNAARLGSDNAFALAHAARTLVYLNNEYDRGVAMIEQALSLNSNLAVVWLLRGWINLTNGNADQAIESFSQFLRISPVDPQRSGACNGMAGGYFALQQYDDSYKWATRALAARNNPELIGLGARIASAVWCGRLDEANDAATELRQIAPEFRIANTHEVFRTRLADFQERMRHAFRIVKIPE